MTLREKEQHFEKILTERHKRRGYIAPSNFKRPGDTSTNVYYVCESDGLWTNMYLIT